MKKLEYIIVQLLSLAGLEFGLFFALDWYWSCFEWSSLGHETSGLEGLVFPCFVWPSFLLAILLKLGLLQRWKYPHCVWYLPLGLCGVAALLFFKSLGMGIFCIVTMVFLPFLELYGIMRADRRPATESGPRRDGAGRGGITGEIFIMRYMKIVVCIWSLVLPVGLYLLLGPGGVHPRSTGTLCYGVARVLVFFDLPIALCLLHWLRPQWFRLKNGWYSPFPWLVLMLVLVCFGWAYIWFTMIPIGLLYLLIRAAAWAVTRLLSFFNRRN